ncbi:hypothetical protein P170DRAFT_414551 [Aspergillus steynii IBT 23096]|uniref:Uncharacterized protein n=1 Tax=Aspergillus steynii IBT 23096 TaxID=1392250 RepID=A0A2I2FZ29_9EURO|nr:uncharacterized protein P170DRAFT_414551 [Aspergillus steynii IBT 23096]PLB45893.1 hypothetical protein P170DRAFT_414551 [Aspergillus steynii IBT 23096]
MFRRRRSSSQHHQPLSSSSAQSAQSAASHAFLKSRPSSSSLSSAAAATALRNLTPPPTDVENVQTKRMIQRQSSVSSQPSASATLRSSSRNGLRRSNSSNSMSTRTFREQSPRRPVSSSGPGPVKNAPPIPSIPKEYTGRSTPARRSVSVGGSMRSSPPVKHPSGRGGSVDRENMRTVSPSLYTVPEAQRTGSSINFSYPINSRPNSPSQPPEASDGRDVSTGALLADRLAGLSAPKAQNIPSQPANTSARRRTRNSSPGSPGKGTPPVTTAIAAAQAAIIPSSPSVTTEHREPEVRESLPASIPASPESKPSPSRHALMKRPSTVREDYQGEEKAEASAPVKINPTPRTGRVTPEGPSVARIPQTPDTGRDSLQSSVMSSPESTGSAEFGRGLQPSPLRQASSSPGRSTRFSTQLSVTGLPGDLLHKPPPRSVSPVKSAMKSSRVSSLSPDGRTGVVLRPGPPLSEISDGTSVGSDDGSKQGFRKKAAKVSFDDEAEVVGVAASPPTSPESVVPDSPPGTSKAKSKSNWFGLGKKKFHPRDTAISDEFDEVLRPRPVLPSFGSIRGARDGEHAEPIRHEFSDNDSTTSSEPNLGAPDWSFSNDHKIGAILSNNEHNDTRASSEHHELAMSPETTAKSSRPDPPSHPASMDESTEQGHTQDTPSAHDDVLNHPNSSPALGVPGIAVQPATPELEKERSSLDWCTVPGGFPRASLESKTSSRRKGKKAVDNSAAHTVEDQDTDDDSGESIYSDAEEGFDGDNFGFGSINAIVDSSTGPIQDELVDATRESTKNDGAGDRASDAPSDMPETCQIARVETPVRSSSPPPPARSPASPQEPLPFSSPYPPFPTRPSAKKSNTQEQVPRESMVANSARRSMSTDAYEGPATQDVVARQNGDTRTPSAAGQKPVKTRPASWGGGLLKSKEAISEEAQQANGHGAHHPQRRLSNGSDSSSSFVRSNRPARASPQYTMRRTMRGIPPPRMQTASPNRQKSPPPDMRPQSSGSGTAGALRTTLRGNENRREKPSFFSTGKMQKAKIAKAPGSRFTSRYPDSDEEHGSKDARPWQSRYENSSDDEPEMNNLRPVRGIPRRAGKDDGDSTELEDSSDGERHRPAASPAARKPSEPASPKNPALAAVAKSRGMTEKEAEDFLRRPNIERRPSLFHRFTIRKPKPSAERGSSAKLGQLDADQVREQPVLDPNQGNIVTTITANPGTPSSPRLLKRGAYRSTGGESWPLRGPPKELINGNHASERPQTADGAGQNGSTAVGDDAISVSKENQNPLGISGIKADGQQSTVDNHSTPRKKRFPKIRKAFGLRS